MRMLDWHAWSDSQCQNQALNRLDMTLFGLELHAPIDIYTRSLTVLQRAPHRCCGVLDAQTGPPRNRYLRCGCLVIVIVILSVATYYETTEIYHCFDHRDGGVAIQPKAPLEPGRPSKNAERHRSS
ncbi:hypothetical protein BDR06DRAFT_402445 [Suillus hirtellus]|nr:hypothetical protein BDR06DRAFT_402445 [Suillus hirtellus]